MDAKIEKYQRKLRRLQRRDHHKHRHTKTRSRSRSTRGRRRTRSRSRSTRCRRSRSRSPSTHSRRRRQTRSNDSRSRSESRSSTFESRHISLTPESSRGRDDDLIQQSTAPNLIQQPTAPNLIQQPTTSNFIQQPTAPNLTPLSPHLLKALGDEKPTDKEEYGENLHEVISVRWEETLKVGLPEKRKEELLGFLKIPNNCQMLEAPTLNPEVSAALTEVAINRDQTLKAKQQQLGLGITFMGHALSKLLDKENNTAEIISYLSKAGQLLLDIHSQDTKTRVQLLAPSLDKSFLKLAETVTRDKYLFGDNLIEKIKHNSTIEKSGQQIRKMPQASTKPKGNWNGPPRNYHQQRTTPRGGPRRYPAAQSSRGRKPYAPPTRRPQASTSARPERNYSQRARPRH